MSLANEPMVLIADQKDEKATLSASYVIACGITSAGKSFLLSAMACQPNLFSSFETAAAGTKKVSQFTVETKLGKKILTDTPGPSNPDSKEEENDHQQVCQALSDNKAFQTWLFVLSPIGGRLSDGDMNAYDRLRKCFGVKPESILCVVNKLKCENHEFDRYKQELLEDLAECKIQFAECLFIPEVSPGDEKTLFSVGQQLWNAESKLIAKHHSVIQERETKERLKAQLLLNQKEEEKLRLAKQAEDSKLQQLQTEQNALLAQQQQELAERARQNAARELAAQQEIAARAQQNAARQAAAQHEIAERARQNAANEAAAQQAAYQYNLNLKNQQNGKSVV